MNNKDAVSLLIGIVLSLTGTFTGYFMYSTHERITEVKHIIQMESRESLAQYKEVKRNYESVLKDYVAKSDYYIDRTALKSDIAGIRADLRIRRK